VHIDVYDSTTVRDWESTNTLFYEISLNDESETKNDLSQYIHKSHENKNDSILVELLRERIRLKKENLLMCNEKTAFEYLRSEDASFMLLKFSWNWCQVFWIECLTISKKMQYWKIHNNVVDILYLSSI